MPRLAEAGVVVTVVVTGVVLMVVMKGVDGLVRRGRLHLPRRWVASVLPHRPLHLPAQRTQSHQGILVSLTNCPIVALLPLLHRDMPGPVPVRIRA